MATIAKKPSEKLTAKHIFGYGCGDAGGVCGLYMVSGYMTRFLQVNLEVNAGILATMLLIWNIWDAVNDPLMGTIMDMFFAKAKPGADKFRPWILASIPILVIGLISFFVVPPMMGGGVMMIASAFILKIVFEAGYTMMNIGMGSLIGNMAMNDNERATLSSARGFGSTLGGFVGGALIPLCLGKFGMDNAGFAKTAIVMAIPMGILVFLHYALTEERNKVDPSKVVEKTQEEKDAEKFKITDIWNIITKNRAFLALVLHSICICGVQALAQGATTYMYVDVLHNISIQSLGSTMSTALMVVILLAAPILTKKWDLVLIIRMCLLAGLIAYAGLLAYALMAAEMNAVLFVVWNSCAGALVQMSVQMQWGLVAESIDYNEYLTGKRNEGTIYGFFSLSRRIGSTIANSASVLIIAAIGYDAAVANAGGEQSDFTIMGIKLMVLGFPLIAALGSWSCFTFIWNINKDVRAKMAEWKAAKLGK
ncbi:MAG: MFS transporter [Oscillospiraceae bacterium]|nr:MFS transporter [Oscillospiraceae bacterium]